MRKFNIDASDSTIIWCGAIHKWDGRENDFHIYFENDKAEFFFVRTRDGKFHLVNYEGEEGNPKDFPILKEIYEELEKPGASRKYVNWYEDKHKVNSDALGRYVARSPRPTETWRMYGRLCRMDNIPFRNRPETLKEDSAYYFAKFYNELRKYAEQA